MGLISLVLCRILMSSAVSPWCGSPSVDSAGLKELAQRASQQVGLIQLHQESCSSFQPNSRSAPERAQRATQKCMRGASIHWRKVGERYNAYFTSSKGQFRPWNEHFAVFKVWNGYVTLFSRFEICKTHILLFKFCKMHILLLTFCKMNILLLRFDVYEMRVPWLEMRVPLLDISVPLLDMSVPCLEMSA